VAPQETWPSVVPGTRFADVRHLPEVGSTNDLVLAAARQGAPEGLVVAADHQTAGRGRLGRRWEAPPGANLLVSVLLRPALAWEELHWATAVVAMAAADAARQVAGVELVGKWPNDLLSPTGEKVAGVLAEAVGDPGASGPQAVVVGLGLNVAWPGPEDRLPAELAGRVSSLARLGGPVPSRPVLLQALLEHLEEHLVRLAGPGGPEAIRAGYLRWCATIGQRVRVQLGQGTLEGRAETVESSGALVVLTAEGHREVVAAGDVQHLRPQGA
jgi:BirA family biotin operon repressor/biotin-[acetyl-CoA-carboxylase] ligase